jgi:hypothetical protein
VFARKTFPRARDERAERLVELGDVYDTLEYADLMVWDVDGQVGAEARRFADLRAIASGWCEADDESRGGHAGANGLGSPSGTQRDLAGTVKWSRGRRDEGNPAGVRA